MIKRELLLVMKTNNYLRAIDRRLGNPNNTINVVNEVTWSVYQKDVAPRLSYWAYFRESFRYYFVRVGLYVMYLNLKCRMMFGLEVADEELEDFDLDVVHRDSEI